MEQTNLHKATVTRRWWAYRSKVEHPEDNESIEYGVPFVRGRDACAAADGREGARVGGRILGIHARRVAPSWRGRRRVRDYLVPAGTPPTTSPRPEGVALLV